ncbi:hypothetical protein ACFL26_00455 [Patescibacteria group bacterium]
MYQSFLRKFVIAMGLVCIVVSLSVAAMNFSVGNTAGGLFMSLISVLNGGIVGVVYAVHRNLTAREEAVQAAREATQTDDRPTG